VKINDRLGITEHLLMLERGRHELVLANYLDLKPMYVKRGRKYVANFLKTASELGSYKKLKMEG